MVKPLVSILGKIRESKHLVVGLWLWLGQKREKRLLCGWPLVKGRAKIDKFTLSGRHLVQVEVKIDKGVHYGRPMV